MSQRTGICINVGNCKNADSKLPIETPIAADFVCPECGRELVEMGGKKKMKLSKPMLIMLPILILFLGAGGYTYYWFSKAKKTVKAGIQTVEKVKEVVEESGIVPVIKDKIEEISEAQKTTTPETQQPTQSRQPNKSDDKTVNNSTAPVVTPAQKESACKQISASSIDDFLSKVSDKQIPNCEKGDMIKNYTKFFSSSQAFVNIVDNNGSIMRRFGAKDYVTRLTGSGKQVFVQQGGQTDGNKYVELMVREL
ncbi:MAG: hypothetical protein M9887_02000 [Chitinophagales bacterium]|nr:hypothetical protein [Chitinophagales bacterium]